MNHEIKVIQPMDALLRPEVVEQVKTAGGAYGLVAWVYRCAHLRANAVAGMPFSVRRRATLDAKRLTLNSDGGSDERPPVGSGRAGVERQALSVERRALPVTAEEFPFLDALPRLLWLTECSLSLFGAAYWFHQKNRVRTLGLRWFAPQTVLPRYDASRGLVGFERIYTGREMAGSTPGPYPGPEFDPLGGSQFISGAQPAPFDPDDLIHFWMPDPEVEIGPGRCPGDVALEVAGLTRNANLFAAQFFSRGAIPSVVLAVEGNPPETEMRRLEAWWKRLSQGVKNAWSTVAVRASVKPIVIGQPIRDLDMPGLSQTARQQIAVAFGVPQTLLEDAASYATATEHRKSFYSETVVPECKLIEQTLNTQLLHRLGLEFRFQPEQHEVMQEDEVQRAGALVTLRNAGIPLTVALDILGYDLTDESKRALAEYVSSREWEYARARQRKDAEAAQDPLNLLRHLVAPLQQSLGDNGLGRNLEP